MIDRRSILRMTIAGVILLSKQSLFAQEHNEEGNYKEIRTPFPTNYRLFGTCPALGPEEDQARTILETAPVGKTLLETARYFEGLKIKNSEDHMYNAQWPTRWNPVIVGFYQSAKFPYWEGDTTAWCAAFINWCLRRGGYQSTKSASSGSFRESPAGPGLGTITHNPKPGDIIVFKKINRQEANAGRGHVGIYVAKAAGGYMVLGGNQKAGKEYSSVNTTFFPAKGSENMFDSIRSFDSLQKVNEEFNITSSKPKPKLSAKCAKANPSK